MSDRVLKEFTRQYIRAQKVPEVVFGWQGGEPLLMGLDFFRKAVKYQEHYAKSGMRILNAVQTNGTLIDAEWARFFHEHGFLVGVSLDGPAKLHDAFRKDPHGKGTFKRVKQGIDFLKKARVEYNLLTCVNASNVEKPLEVYTFFRDEIGANFIQFIPIIERNLDENNRELPSITDRSVPGGKYGEFLIEIFDEWVRNDVGTVFVQIFDVTLGAWMGRPGGLCVFAETCGNAMALEHNGDLYACDHYVNVVDKRGNIMDNQLINLIASRDQMKFGLRKKTDLPRACRACKWLFACNGGCLKNRVDASQLDDGTLDKFKINHLCKGYQAFFNHVDSFMKFMAKKLRNRRPAADIMEFLKEHDIS
ncbi:anaerobic sulfatase maturase, partial [Candidatus Bathyarchaeota archaeon]|nr:anaerobic sulfatase maturase [Candidatus Bathyarchaeota archaeon]